MSARIAVQLATTHPEQVRALVLVGSGVLPGKYTPKHKRNAMRSFPFYKKAI